MSKTKQSNAALDDLFDYIDNRQKPKAQKSPVSINVVEIQRKNKYQANTSDERWFPNVVKGRKVKHSCPSCHRPYHKPKSRFIKE